MVSAKTKKELIGEIEKNGNVSLSCAKIGVDKSTFYRWMEKYPEFRKLAKAAAGRGRRTNCDIAESSLMFLIKQKNLPAIKYYLVHNDPRYRARKNERSDKHIVIEHRVTGKAEKSEAAAGKVEDIKVIIVSAKEELEELRKREEEKNSLLAAENSDRAEESGKPPESSPQDAEASAPQETGRENAEGKNDLPKSEVEGLSK